MHILSDSVLSLFKDESAKAITSFRSHRELTVLPTINNPGASKSIMLANLKDAISKRYLHSKRNIELIVFPCFQLFKAVNCYQERGKGGRGLLALFILQIQIRMKW